MTAKLAVGVLQTQVSLASLTSWEVGGCAARFYQPRDSEDLTQFLKQFSTDESFLWLGLGSNVLVRDGGLNSTVIHTLAGLKQMEVIEPNIVRVEAGIPCPSLARFCARQGLRGVEFLAGVPGTIGGALRMNAGAFGGETWEYVVKVETIDRNGQRHHRTPTDYEISYRTVNSRYENEWFIAGYFALTPGDKEASFEMIKRLLDQRAQAQPTGQPSCGSVFRNPPGDHAGRLIESLGLKGMRVGGAVVSEKHANFIINEGTATAADIEALINQLQAAVHARYNILLHPEVHVVGEALVHSH